MRFCSHMKLLRSCLIWLHLVENWIINCQYCSDLRREDYLQTVLIAPIATSFAPFVSAVPKTAIDGDVIGTQSVRQRFFEGSKVPLDTAIVLLYCWSADFLQFQIRRETHLSKPTVSQWCAFIRYLCETTIENNPQELGGFNENSETIEVEINESKFFHRKYHSGQWRERHWVFGAVERRTRRCWSAWSHGSHLRAYHQALDIAWHSSDGWAAYANIENIANGIYTHSVIVHERNFVDPIEPGVHTQVIENTSMRAKQKLRRQHGTSVELFALYMAEFMWRCRVGDNKFAELILAIRQQYPF